LKIPFRQLERHLRDRLANAYLIAGDEPLLVDEALEAVRAAARGRGFDSRELHMTDRSFRWAELAGDADNLSLFASRKIVELRLGSARPGDAGSRTIAELVEKADPDRLLIVVVAEKIDSSAARTAWVKALEQHGVFVEIWPIERTELPRWLDERARAAGLTLTSAAAQLLAERLEGNLLAADQQIKRLALLAPGSEVDEAQVLEAVADNARFDVFRLTDAVLAADSERAFRVLDGLRAEGVAPVLVSWALAREIGLLARLQFAVAHGESLDNALMKNGVWRRRQPLVKQALARLRRHDFKALVAGAAQADNTIKGAAPGQPWEALTGLLLALLRPAGAH
jgi:DNA polymerase-3 subunit delta